MDVKIKDRNERVEFLRMALNMSELPVSYIQTDLIIRTINVLNKEGGDFNLMDAAKIYSQWQQNWETYFKKNDTRQDDSGRVPQGDE
jgi:hypothetical protein